MKSDWLKTVWLILRSSVKDFFHDSGPQWAAAIAFYSLLSAFPLFLGAASIIAFFIDPTWALERIGNVLGDLMPQGSGQIENIVKDAISKRNQVSIFSIGALLWTGSRVFGATTRALNQIFDAEDRYSFLKRLLVQLIMLLSIGLLFVLALASRFILRLLRDQILSFLGDGQLFFTILHEALPALLLLASFLLIYRYAPRTQVFWKSAVAGAVVATLLFLLARPIFITYVQRFANYNLIYGPIAIAIVMMLWAWVVAILLLFGGEVTTHVQRTVFEGQRLQKSETKHGQRSVLQTNQTDRS